MDRRTPETRTARVAKPEPLITNATNKQQYAISTDERHEKSHLEIEIAALLAFARGLVTSWRDALAVAAAEATP